MTSKLIEVPFTITMSGTRLVCADNDTKGREAVEASLRPNLNLESQLWKENEDVALKDGLRTSVQISTPSHSALSEKEIKNKLSPKMRQELGWEVDLDAGKPFHEKDGEDGTRATFDEDSDGIDKPGDDRNVPTTPEERLSARPTEPVVETTRQPPLGPIDSKQVKQEQPTGAPTTANTSAGAVNPQVNRPSPQPPRPANTAPAPRPAPQPAKR